MHKKTSGALAPWLQRHYISKPGVGRGGGQGGVAYKDLPPPPPVLWSLLDVCQVAEHCVQVFLKGLSLMGTS